MTSLFFFVSLEERRRERSELDSALTGMPCDKLLDDKFDPWLLLKAMSGRAATVSQLIFACEREVRTTIRLTTQKLGRTCESLLVDPGSMACL